MKKLIAYIQGNKKEIIAAIAILCVFFLLRLYHLKSMPLFNDEAINVRRAQLGAYDPSQRLFSLVDGKQPLYIWIISFVMLKIGNPVASAKLVSLIGGFLTMVTLFVLTDELFKNKKLAVISMALYTFYPFAVLINRQVLFENYVGFFSVLSLYFAVRLARGINLGNMFLLAHAMGAGILTKSSGFFNIYLLPVSALVLREKKKLGKWALYALAAVGFAYLYYSIIYLSPYASAVGAKNNVFIYTVGELIPNHAFFKWPGQFIQFGGWVVEYLAIVAFVPIFFSFRNKKFTREIVLLFLWAFLPFIAFSLFAKLPYPRHLYAMTLTLIPLIVLGLEQIGKTFKRMKRPVVLLGVVLLAMTYSDGKIVTDLPHAPIPALDLFQYANGWPAGGGVKEIVSYLLPIAASKQIIIVTEGGFGYGGLAASSVDIYFANNPNVTKVEVNDVPFVIPDSVLKQAQGKPVYVLLNRYQGALKTPVDELMRFQKGIGNSYIRLYKVR